MPCQYEEYKRELRQRPSATSRYLQIEQCSWANGRDDNKEVNDVHASVGTLGAHTRELKGAS